MNLTDKRIFIIPDAYIGNSSGAGVTQTVVRALSCLGVHVAIYSTDVEDGLNGDVTVFKALPSSAKTNYFKLGVLKHFQNALDKYKPTNVFFVGSITNKSLAYLEEALRRQLHIDVFIFMQDFFCAKFYANDAFGPCTKCLDEGLCHVFHSKCGVREHLGKMQLLVRWDIRRRLKKLLPKVNHVITSTREQCEFYQRFGVNKDRTYIMPLPFTSIKLDKYTSSCGDYFIGIAQLRVEKGFQFIPQILEHVDSNVKIRLAFCSDREIKQYRECTDVERFITNGRLQLISKSWSTGLGDVIAGSRGVIIPSIWPTTTEFGLLEALGLKKPVFAFNISVHREILANYYPKNLFELGDFKAFGKRLSLYSDNEYRSDGEKSREIYKQMVDFNLLKSHLKELL